ncbi:MAG: ATP-grasp domain-containing protein, partial [Acidobacteriota bacterium]
MIIIDKPYVSDHVVKTILKNKFRVLKNHVSESLLDGHSELLLNEDEAVKILKEDSLHRIYTISENSIEWVVKNMGFTGLPDKIDLFKNKTRFRDMTREIYPDLFYREVAVEDLKNIEVEELPLPVILKPSVGFFSMGVNKINSPEDWYRVAGIVASELERFGNIYPDEVLDIKKFIIEEFIEGDEYAIDAYFNSEGEPVVLGIL